MIRCSSLVCGALARVSQEAPNAMAKVSEIREFITFSLTIVRCGNQRHPPPPGAGLASRPGGVRGEGGDCVPRNDGAVAFSLRPVRLGGESRIVRVRPGRPT